MLTLMNATFGMSLLSLANCGDAVRHPGHQSAVKLARTRRFVSSWVPKLLRCGNLGHSTALDYRLSVRPVLVPSKEHHGYEYKKSWVGLYPFENGQH